MNYERTLRCLLGSLALLAATACLAEEHYDVIVEREVAARMRDGTVLRADVYRPKADGQFPVLLQRSPYDKHISAGSALRGAARGYVVVIQDVRGRYTSEGEWYPFKYESQDGFDTVEWAAALPGSNGKVGMFGSSYVGATQMLAAMAAPPHLAGIFPCITASNYHDGWTYQGGAFEQLFNELWTSGLALDTLTRRAQPRDYVLRRIFELPLQSFPLFDAGAESGSKGTLSALAPYYIDWLAHPVYDDFWKQVSIEEHFSMIKVPALHLGAWYDIFQRGTLRNYVGIKERGASLEARQGQRLMVFTSGHAGAGQIIGEVDFGKNSVIDTDEIMLRWYDYLLKGAKNGLENEKPVKIFVLGKNVWREEDDWPLARAQSTRFYLHSQGKANSLSGSGTLNTEAPQAEPADRFVYNPAEPVPTRGGALCCSIQKVSGALDQRPIEARDDVLVFTTPPFKQDFEVTGPVSLELFADSSAVDTDFTAKLVDVWPNGFAQNLTDGILRARYRNSQEKPEFMNPGEVYRFTIDMVATSNVFLKGHKLRLEVSSSNFPRFDRNLNTGEEAAQGTRGGKATNTIYHDHAHPSALVLPVVP